MGLGIPLPGASRVASRSGRSTALSALASAGLHALLLGVLALTAGKARHAEGPELMEISYIVERYGAEVASRVTIAPERLAAVRGGAPKLEGSIFGRLAPDLALRTPTAPLAPAIQSAPTRERLAAAAPAAPPVLESRERPDTTPAAPLAGPPLAAAPGSLAGGDTAAPAALGPPSAPPVDLAGAALVGRPAAEAAAAPFAVAETEPPGAPLTLAAPAGGWSGGHPRLAGGSLPPGKEAWRGELPGNGGRGAGGTAGKGLAARDALARLAAEGPAASGRDDGPATTGGTGGGTSVGATRGRGLVSRGGADALTRSGSLIRESTRDGGAAGPAGDVEAMPPEASGAGEAKRSLSEGGVSLTLSGPILDREILFSAPPRYPAEARRRAWQGACALYFTVREDGSVGKVLIETASPHRVLDEAARRSLERWRFAARPGAAEQWGILTVVFRLR